MRESNANQNPGWHTQLDMRIKKKKQFILPLLLSELSEKHKFMSTPISFITSGAELSHFKTKPQFLTVLWNIGSPNDSLDL